MFLRISQQKVLKDDGHARKSYEKGQAKEEAENPRNSWLADTGSKGTEPGQDPAEVREAAVESEAVQGKYSRHIVIIPLYFHSKALILARSKARMQIKKFMHVVSEQGELQDYSIIFMIPEGRGTEAL